MFQYLSWVSRRFTLMGLGIVLGIGYFTYFRHYEVPPNLFWDENYHLTSAQKYMNHVFFMETHPPLGKLFIALGEKIMNGDPAKDMFISTNYARRLPSGFSFKGYRLFPTVFSWLCAGLFFLILIQLIDDPISAFLLSGLYLFDNAIIAHGRGAMLEPTLLFFTLLYLLLYLTLSKSERAFNKDLYRGAAWGATFALVMATKVVGLVLILLVPLLLWKRRFQRLQLLQFLGVFLLAAMTFYFAVWAIHFRLGTRIVPELTSQGWFTVPPERQGDPQVLTSTPRLGFLERLRYEYRYAAQWNAGVPRLNLCKPGENGSPFFFWPVGARAINYRWETPDGISYKYLYLQSNPVGWLVGLFGVFLSFAFVASYLLGRGPKPDRFFEMASLLILYLSYMVGVSRIPRVMYLYHYFLPLVISYLLFALAWINFRRIGTLEIGRQTRRVFLGICSLAVFGTFLFYSPLTYYRPLTDAQFHRRQWVALWHLVSVRDSATDGIVVPCSDPPKK